MKRPPGLIPTLAVLSVVAPPPASAEGQRGLTDLKTQIIRSYPAARSLSAEQFEAKVATAKAVAVFDVRERSEYEVSRIPGAIHVHPGISAAEFVRRYGDEIRGRVVLLYCSVGVRSSRLATRIDAQARSAGADGTFNLMGGIFSWHNTGRTLVKAGAETEAVHGYSRDWARYLDFDNLARLERWGLW